MWIRQEWRLRYNQQYEDDDDDDDDYDYGLLELPRYSFGLRIFWGVYTPDNNKDGKWKALICYGLQPEKVKSSG